jgi:hypothetical protein
MKVYYAYYQDYEDIRTIGVFSSREDAEAALTHWHDDKLANDQFCFYNRNQGHVDEYVLDEYTTVHMSPLAKALEE